ncbi:MAG TPA: tRNA (adenosine(37)-N6)-dimethylallyltransferase MiaA, partial [Gammaproteobacteria bacterium]|nr:tRNA (adenosine(37)-N6)-dimethylallyltransferase MiaA [Gammaproteobacteria bacterium]
PTASGKTALAVELVQRLKAEIISVDSAMIYRDMDIGTAKPDAETLERAPHRLIDICDPAEAYSAGDFQKDALREIDNILQQGKIPLLVGGTMMYFHLLQNGLDELPTRNEQIRQQILQEAETLGWPELHKKLTSVDPEAAKRIHPHDSQRIQRALEVFALTGKPITEYQLQQNKEHAFGMINVIVSPTERSTLHQRIEKRFSQMLDLGFIEEVKQLKARPDLSLQKPSMRCVGYRQVWEHLDGQYSFEEMREKAIAATRQLAKRQITWLRRWQDATWIDSETLSLQNQVATILKSLS